MATWQNLKRLLGVLLSAMAVQGQELAEIPANLAFSCAGRAYGYYADPQTNCQVFHICLGEEDIKWSFLCPNHTIFNQQYFVCDFSVNVDCQSAESFYSLNGNFGAVIKEELSIREGRAAVSDKQSLEEDIAPIQPNQEGSDFQIDQSINDQEALIASR